MAMVFMTNSNEFAKSTQIHRTGPSLKPIAAAAETPKKADVGGAKV